MSMSDKRSKLVDSSKTGHKKSQDFSALSRKILKLANRGAPRIQFLRELSRMLIQFSGCDAVELRITDGKLNYRWEARDDGKSSFEILPSTTSEDGNIIPCFSSNSGAEKLCRIIVSGKPDPSLPFFTKNGSFWTPDISRTSGLRDEIVKWFPHEDGYRSIVMIPFVIDEENSGLVQLKRSKKDFFTLKEVEFYEGVAQTIGLAVAGRRSQAKLRERVKELTCLYGIARLVEEPGISLEKILGGIADLLPPAMRYPDIASARIILDDKEYCSPPECEETRYRLAADIVVNGVKRGVAEVFYSEEKPELEVELFITEEQSLLDAVAGQLVLIIEHRQWEAERTRLEEQLRHADRLATLGQLAAGVAHELNEPLEGVLGFAQLARKSDGLPKQAGKDIEKIESAALHAREVVKKLLIFARQMPTHKTLLNLNQVVEEGLYFLESRCEKEGIEVVRDLAEELAEITADPSQLNQVLVNLVVNGLQAMSGGGRLTIRTRATEEEVILIVEDTGTGMDEEVQRQIFLPFFTTKEVGQGTGLGLAVVHGIVTSHGGTIEVESKKAKGSRFTVKLPLMGTPTKEKTHDTPT